MTSNHHAPYDLGHTCYNGWYNVSRESVTASQSLKASSVRLWWRNLAYMKSESLVIADQHAAVNTFPGLGTRPPSHEFVTPEVGDINYLSQPPSVDR